MQAQTTTPSFSILLRLRLEQEPRFPGLRRLVWSMPSWNAAVGVIAWSPDGSRLAHRSDEGGKGDF